MGGSLVTTEHVAVTGTVHVQYIDRYLSNAGQVHMDVATSDVYVGSIFRRAKGQLAYVYVSCWMFSYDQATYRNVLGRAEPVSCCPDWNCDVPVKLSMLCSLALLCPS